MTRVTVFNENYHEVIRPEVRKIYNKGIHGTIAEFLQCDDTEVKTVTLYDDNGKMHPDCGITNALLQDTDVIIWWGHCHHEKVSDEVVDMIHNNILCGMGAIFLHSAHHSKLFKKLMGTTCNLNWRDGEKERLWNINPSHPIMQGIGDYIDIPEEEMYGERFQIPKPDDILMLGTYSSHEVFRSACVWQRVYGKIFYFQPGHETYPIYHMEEIQRIIKNAVNWAKPLYRERELICPDFPKIEL